MKSPLYLNALLNYNQLNNAMQVYVDGALTLEDFALSDGYLSAIAPGPHRVSVKAWRGNQAILTANITVSDCAATCLRTRGNRACAHNLFSLSRICRSER